MNSRKLIRELKDAGWTVARTKSSHFQMTHPERNYILTVPHPKKDLPKGLVIAIKKQAGI